MAFGISNAQHSQMVWDQGRQWIKRNVAKDEYSIDIIEQSPLFWAWWRNLWQQRDEKFVWETCLKKQELPLTGKTKEIAIELYNEAHDVTQIKERPNRFVIEEIGRFLRAAEKVEIERLKQLLYAGK
jgi:hypothetical protein